MTICIDLDGTICSEDGSYSDRTPLKGAIYQLKQARTKGHTIIIHTGRHIMQHRITTDWLKRYKIPYDLIQFGKPVADVYIDNLGLKFTSWNDLAL